MSTSVAESATAALRDLLARGRYQPGDRLPPERELAEGLGLSRPTLREAIRRLTEASLLESRQGSGTYVADIDFAAVFEVRLQLEPFAAAVAARLRSDDDLLRLDALVKLLPGLMDDPEAFTATDLQIHRAVADASGNPVLRDFLERLTELTRLSRPISSPATVARRTTLRDLRRLVRAVRANDAEAASTAMTVHLESMREIVERRAPRDRRISPAVVARRSTTAAR